MHGEECMEGAFGNGVMVEGVLMVESCFGFCS